MSASQDPPRNVGSPGRGVARILDANANRAREALRVLEEAARFLLDNRELASALKADRHALVAALSAAGDLTAGRDVAGDVGRETRTPDEALRSGPADVVAAAGSRLAEALRVLAEYGKAVPGVDVATLEAIRYRGYTLAAEAKRGLDRQAAAADRAAALRARPWRVCVLLDRAACALPWERVLDEALAAGADCVQLREKGGADRDRLAHARSVVSRCRGRAAVIVNDRPDLALLAGADGVHLGQDDLAVADARRVLGPRGLVGVSATNAAELGAAVAAGADSVGLGPMFSTSTKPDKAVVGPAWARAALAAHPGLPHLAIGGITPENAGQLAALGVRGVAVASAVTASRSPGEVVAGLRRALENVSPGPDDRGGRPRSLPSRGP